MEQDPHQADREESGSEYAERLPHGMKEGGVGDDRASDGPPQPWNAVGVGGTADFGGLGNLADTSSIREGGIGRGDVPGSRTGSVAPRAGLDTGSSEAAQGGIDAIRDLTQPDGETRQEPLGPVDAAPVTPGPQDVTADVGLPSAAMLGIEGVADTEARLGNGDPGAADLSRAAGGTLGSSLGATRSSPSGNERDQPRGDITGVGGTRGSGEGTGHLTDIGGSGGLGKGSATT